MSSTAEKRVQRLQKHLLGSEGAQSDSKDLALAPTRSLSQWGSDIWSMATKKVITTDRHGGDLVAEVLKAHKVPYIFTLSGGHISPVLVSSKALGIRIIDVRHEVNAVFAADAVGRLTGIPGVAAVTAGPGVTNTVTAIKNCQMAQSPLVLLGGAAATVMQGRGALQDIDQMAVLKPIVKWCVSCRSARDIVPMLRRAFQEAVSGVPGPVFVELPLDVLYPVMEMLAQDGTHSRLRARELQGLDPNNRDNKAVLSRVVIPVNEDTLGMTPKQYVDSRPEDSPIILKNPPGGKDGGFVMKVGMAVMNARLYAGAFEKDAYPDFGPLPVKIPMPVQMDVDATILLLSSAKKPVVLLGSQATLLGEEASHALADSLKQLGVPCYLGGMSRGLLGRNHPIHIRQNRGNMLKKCDMLIMLGVVADFRLDYGRSLPKNVPIVSVNRSQEDLTKNSSIFWTPTLTALSDPNLFMRTVVEGLATRHPNKMLSWDTWTKQLKDAERQKEATNLEKSKTPAMGQYKKEGQELINPLYLCQMVEDLLPDDAILVADGGDFVATAAYTIRPRGPLSWLDPGAFGTLGVGGGFALGAKLVRPTAEVWLLWGDGSCGYSILEYDTFTRHGVPVIGLVGNDACWTQIAREQVPMFQDDAACELDYLKYHDSATSLGGRGIELRNSGDVQEALQKAQEIVRKEKLPVLVNAYIGKTDFREGSISV